MAANPLSHRASPSEVASYWLNQHRSGEMGPDERRWFEAWIAADPVHKAAYERAERLWGAFSAVADDPRVIAARRESLQSRDKRLRRGAIAAVAASFVACVGALAFWSTSPRAPADAGALIPFASGSAEFQTSVGQRTTMRLPDQSVVTLDTDTILKVHDRLGERLVTLERGRAFFKVAKDPTRPFIVQTRGHRVLAIGTEFDVRVGPKDFEVTLIEGRVKVETRSLFRPAATTAQLSPGQRLEVEDSQPQLMKVDLRTETTWHEGRLTFASDPVASAVAEMNRYSDRKIVFVGETPNRAIVGVFRAGDVDSFTKALVMRGIARVVGENEGVIELAAN